MGRLKENMIEGDEAGRRTTRLGDLVGDDIPVFCWCNRCSHNATVDLSLLIARL